MRFNRDTSSCAKLATAHREDASSITASTLLEPTTIQVVIRTHEVGEVDSSFSLLLIC
ncbi:MAG: hypothetical protein ACRDHM_01975 [Actinomycetota bacterium]